MRRIVFPLAATDVGAIATTNVVDAITTANVRVSVEVVIDIHVDVTTAPAGTPTPTAAPGCAHGPTNAERDRTGGNYRPG